MHQHHILSFGRIAPVIILWLMTILFMPAAAYAQQEDQSRQMIHTPLRMLVLSPHYGSSTLYYDFEYMARQLQAEMVFWHIYPREWDVYHLMDTVRPNAYKAALKPNRERANQRLRELLEEQWDVVFWIRYDLPGWAREKLADRIKAGLPVIYLGNEAPVAANDQLTELLGQCKTVMPAQIGATAHDYLRLTRLPSCKALPPDHQFILLARAHPFHESAVPEHDEVTLLIDFWREVIAGLTDRILPTSDVQAVARRAEVAKTTWPVALTISSDRPGADYGQPIGLTLQTPTLPPEYQGNNHVLLAMTDHAGRLLWQQRVDVKTPMVNQNITCTLTDFGPNVFAYYVTAWLVHDNEPIAQAAITLYHYKPWDMRRQWQWSAWETLYSESSYKAAAIMRLFQDAGINSLGFGYPTTRSLWWAERYGWRKYGEVTGGSMLWNRPTITTADENELRRRVYAQMDAKFKQFGSSWASSALTLASLGEEPGFSSGWGKTYYWEQDTAPDVAQKVFQQFLKERYGSLHAVSQSWQTPLANWSDALLVRQYAMRGPQFEPSQTVEDLPEDALDVARYEDTSGFFNWYFRKVATYATERLHQLNPGVKGFYSLHGPDNVGQVGVAHNHHIYYPKEYQALEASHARLHHQDEPSFSLIWNHFDEQAIVNAGLWSQITNQVTHVNLWLGFPLIFNNDMTHTRASMVLKRMLTRFQPASNPIAQATVDTQGIALLDSSLLTHQKTRKIRSLQAAYAALAEAGFPPAFVDQHSLDKTRLVFASGTTHLDDQLAQKLKQYVEQGGTLVTTAGFATRSQYGKHLPVAPGFGLAKWMGFEFGTPLTSNASGLGERVEGGPFKTHSSIPELDGIVMASSPHAVHLNHLGDDVTVLARYQDGTPAMLHRQIGEGHLYHMNFLHEQWRWPTLAKPERESLRRLISGIATASSIRPKFFIECLSDELPHGHAMPYWGSQLFLGHDRKTQYLVVFNDHRSPLITGRIHWYQPDWQVDDLLEGRVLTWSHQTKDGSHLDVSLLPGQGKVLRLTPLGHEPEPVALPDPTPDAGHLPAGFAPVIPRGWPSEQLPERRLDADTFLNQLHRLHRIYEQGRTRSDLSYYHFDANEQNRHAVARILAQQHWPDYIDTLQAALESGKQLLLTGQDMGIDPASGLSVTTYRPAILETLAQLGKTPGAAWHSSSPDGQRLTLKLGQGRIILDRTNLDSVAYHNDDYARWHEQWWPQITQASDMPSIGPSVVELDARILKQWLAGRWLPVPHVTINRFADRKSQATIVRHLLPVEESQVITLALPQNARVQSMQLNVHAESYMGFVNSDFEQVQSDLPLGVRVYGRGMLDDQIKQQGRYSLRLEPVEKNKILTTIVGLSLGRRDESLEGKSYTLRLWAKTQQLERLDIKIRAMKWGMPITWDNDLWINVGSLPKGTYDWQPLDFEITLPQTRTNYVLLHFQAQGDKDTRVWLDHMQGKERLEHVTLSIPGRSHEKIVEKLSAEGDCQPSSQSLAQMINAYLPHAPIDLNGMRIIPLQVTANRNASMVRLNNLNVVLETVKDE